MTCSYGDHGTSFPRKTGNARSVSDARSWAGGGAHEDHSLCREDKSCGTLGGARTCDWDAQKRARGSQGGGPLSAEV
ncbi:hypothetical protein MHPYR_340043 [uncultured Mycobacterium sp.]|uniref:Uncharacterized protein n=1 Tax=uncultured Mycobacterium sp. TaxID=171292 RepID=A0A1Y5PD33_9MYCO|nr:hypothetical protein MHPYR_340043 [uncultured Mycobacterium sp.]